MNQLGRRQLLERRDRSASGFGAAEGVGSRHVGKTRPRRPDGEERPHGSHEVANEMKIFEGEQQHCIIHKSQCWRACRGKLREPKGAWPSPPRHRLIDNSTTTGGLHHSHRLHPISTIMPRNSPTTLCVLRLPSIESWFAAGPFVLP